MADADAVRFLKWALPRLGLRWEGFRRVRRQVVRRIARRVDELGLGDLEAYRRYLETREEEWRRLDELCRVTISRFARDRDVYEALGRCVLVELARSAAEAGRREVRAWSAGCASGEEPYSLRLVWEFEAAPRAPGAALRILATDVDPVLLDRARAGVYPKSSVRDLPEAWLEAAFGPAGEDAFRLRAPYRAGVDFLRQDLRRELPDGPFDLVLCRNLAFTYYDEGAQEAVLSGLLSVLRPGGAFVVGRRERLPPGPWPLEPWSASGRPPGIFRKSAARGAPAACGRALPGGRGGG